MSDDIEIGPSNVEVDTDPGLFSFDHRPVRPTDIEVKPPPPDPTYREGVRAWWSWRAWWPR